MSAVDDIKSQVRMYQILTHYRVQYLGGELPEQIHCIGHRPDTNRSARLYPENDTIYCWVCDKTWDVIAAVQELEGLSFAAALKKLLVDFNVSSSASDYEKRLFSLRAEFNRRNKSLAPHEFNSPSEKTVGTVLNELSETVTPTSSQAIIASVETLLRDHIRHTLTNSQRHDILHTINTLYAELDDMRLHPNLSIQWAQSWFASSKSRIRSISHG